MTTTQGAPAPVSPCADEPAPINLYEQSEGGCGMSTMRGAMLMLFNHARHAMGAEELEAIAGLSEIASDEARRLSGVCERLGCLVSSDGMATSCRVGSFQDADSVSDLLFSLAHSFDVIAAMSDVGAEAAYRLNERRQEQEVQP